MAEPVSPSISVVLPVFNAAATLERAIQTIRNQTFTDWELLIVDDGSTDNSMEIARFAARADDRIKVHAIPHGGIVQALNTGVAHSRGEYVARMDADDEAMPDRFAEQVAMLHSHPQIGVVSCLVEYGGSRSSSLGYALHVDWINSAVTPEEIARSRFVESPIAHPTVMFRRDLLEQHGGYRDGDFPEDYELWLRWMDTGVMFAKVPRVLLRWNDPPQRLSRTEARYTPEAFFRMKAGWIARHIAKLPRRPVWIWGAGRPTRKRAAHLEKHGVAIAGYIDVDPKKTGRRLGDRPVLSADAVPSPSDAIVLGYVSSRGARELICAALASRGYVEGRDFLMCA